MPIASTATSRRPSSSTTTTRKASNFADDLRIGGDVADQIAALPEVAAVGGDLTGSVAFLGADGKTTANGAVGRLWIVDDDLNPIDVDEGARRPPRRDRRRPRLADDEDLTVGDSVTVLTLAGPAAMRPSSGSPPSATLTRRTRAAPCRSRRPTRSTG